MATQVQLRRGTTAQNNDFTGAEAEVTVDTTTHTLRVHDGTTVGGFTLAKVSDVTSALSSKQDVSNLVTTVSSDSTDSQYPSAKLFYDTCGDIETLINAL